MFHQEFQVDSIVAERGLSPDKEYLVRWCQEGRPSGVEWVDSWEPEGNLACPEKVEVPSPPCLRRV